MLKYCAIVLLWLFTHSVALSQTWAWQAQMYNSSDDVDLVDLKYNGGYVYGLGTYKVSLTIGTNTYLSFGQQDMFTFKADLSGNIIWVKTAGSPNTELPGVISVDGVGNVYISGGFQNTCSFGTASISGNADNKFDCFIAKYDPSGTLLWAKNVGTGLDNDRITGMELNAAGEIFVGGLFIKDILLGSGGSTASYDAGSDPRHLFVAKFSTTGDLLWSKRYLNNSAQSIIRAVSISEDGSLYIGGALGGMMTIDGINYISAGSGDILIAKLNSSTGVSSWVRKGGGTLDDQLNSITVNEDNVYVTGYVQGTGKVDSTATLQSSSYLASGGLDIFIARYNLEGRLVWKTLRGGSSADNGYGIVVDQNILMTTGYFTGTINFNQKTLTSGGGTDAGFFVFDTDGNPITAEAVSGTLEERGQGIGYDKVGNTYFGGYFMSPTLTIGGSTFTNVGSPKKDGFLVKYSNPFSATFTHKQNLLCNGSATGELTVTTYFGTYPYNYVWKRNGIQFVESDSVATGLVAGTYVVDVTDANSKVASTTYIITQPSPLTVSAPAPAALNCFGNSNGAINITAGGGVTPYAYQWNTSNGLLANKIIEDQTGLIAGNYDVTVTDKNGCSAVNSFAISQPTRINFKGSVVTPIVVGSDGAVLNNVTGGTSSYTYSWSNGPITKDIAAINVGGPYKVTVTDVPNGCVVDTTFFINDLRVFYATLQTKTIVACKGGSSGTAIIAWANATPGTISVIVDGGAPTVYATASGTHPISGLFAGVHTVSVDDGSGAKVVNFTVTEPANALSAIPTTFGTACFNSSDGRVDLSVGGGTAPYSFNWSWVESLVPQTATTQDIFGKKAETYSVVVTDANGCTVSPAAAIISEPSDISFSIDVTPITCFGLRNGVLSISGELGGNGGNTYLWSNTLTTSTVTNLPAATYWARATDVKGCYKQINKTLSQPTILSAGTVVTEPTCNAGSNGTIVVNALGGTPNYEYSIDGGGTYQSNNNFASISAGIKTVTIRDACLCTGDFIVNVGEPTAITITPTPIKPTCPESLNGAIGISVSGGTPGYNYFWTTSDGSGLITMNPNQSGLTVGTYQLDVTDSKSCPQTISVPITAQNASPSAFISTLTNPVCSGTNVASTASGGVTYEFFLNAASVLGPSAVDNYSNSMLANGDLVYAKVYSAVGCVASSSPITMTINPLPIVTLSALSPVCIDSPIFALTGGLLVGGTYSGTGVSGGSFDPAIAGVGPHTITYSYSDANSCVNTATSSITVNALPTVTLGAFSAVCVNASSLVLSGGSPAGGTYSGTGVSGGSFDPATAGVGTYTITYSYTDGSSCVNTVTNSITVNALPTVTLGAFSAICVNASSFVLSGGSPAGGTYSGIGVSGGSFDPAIAGVGPHTITYSYSDANSCVNTATSSITVNALPTVTLGTFSAFCVSAPSFVLSGGSPAGGTYSGIGVSGGSFDPAIAGVGPHAITYSYSDANSCVNTATNSITVNALPTLTLGAFSAVCVNASSLVLSGGSPAGGTYSGIGVSGGSFDPATAGVGTHTITYSYTDGNSCVNTATNSITVNALPTVSLGAFSAVCADAPAFALMGGLPVGGTYSGTGVSGGNFDPAVAGVGPHMITYSYTDGNSCLNSTINSITVNALPSVTLGAFSAVCADAPAFALMGGLPVGGTYSGTGVSGGNFDPAVAGVGSHIITYTYTNGSGCTSSATGSILVNTLPTVDLGGDRAICSGSSVTLDAGVFANYLWNDNSTIQTLIVTNAGPYSVTVTDGNGCSAVSTSVNVTVNPLPTVDLGGDKTTCIGNSVTLDAGVFTTYLWSDNSTNQTLITGIAGSYSVTVTDGNGCQGTSPSINVLVNSLPTVDLGVDQTVCDGNTVMLDAGVFAGYLWSDNSTNQTLITGIPGSYSVTVTDGNGCQGVSAPVTLTVNPLPVVDLGGDKVICAGSSLTLDAGSFSSYLWSDNSIEQTLEVMVAGTFSVTVIDDNGCSNTSATITTVVNPLPIINLGDDLTMYDNGELIVDGTASYAAYLWEKNSISDGTNQTYTIDGAAWGIGSHILKLTATDLYGCLGSDEIAVLIADSDISKLVNSAILYPNPAVDFFRFQFESPIIRPASINIVRYDGKVMLNEQFTAEQMQILEIPIHGFAAGVYYVTLNVDGKKVTKTLVKE